MEIDLSLFEKVKSRIDNAESILITSHKSPDGDSIGCSLGLFHFLKKLNKSVHICHPDEAPLFLNWAKGANEIISNEINPEKVKQCFLNADLIFCLDYNAPHRLGSKMEDLLVQSNAEKILIDHHHNPSIDASVAISEVSRSSTSELICELIVQLDCVSMLDHSICEALYMGMVTDTGSFRYPSVSSRTHELVSFLLNAGLDHSKVHSNIFDNNSIDRLRLRSYAVCNKMEILSDYPCGIISLNKEELLKFNYKKGDTEGLVNVILSVEGMKVGVIVIEREDCIKMSFRSKENYYVNEFASNNFNGGGHKYAAGGISNSNMNETLKDLKGLISQIFD